MVVTWPHYYPRLANQDPTKWASLAILAVEQNFDCSKEITAQQVTAPPGTGYLIELSSTLNETDVSRLSILATYPSKLFFQIYATSQPFEIKATGAAYPVTTSPSSPSPTASAGGSANSSSSAPASGSTGQSSGKSNGASKTSAAVIFAGAAAALGLLLA